MVGEEQRKAILRRMNKMELISLISCFADVHRFDFTSYRRANVEGGPGYFHLIRNLFKK